MLAGYSSFGCVTARNAPQLAKQLHKFKGYIQDEKCEWFVDASADPKLKRDTPRRRPHAFGVIVFDYEPSEKDQILRALRRELGPELTEVEFICELLQHVIHYKSITRNEALARELRAKRDVADHLFQLFLGPRE